LRRSILLAACFTLIGSHGIWGQTGVATSPADVGSTAKPPTASPAAGAVKDESLSATREPLPASIFFTPDEQQQMHNALIAYEKSKTVKASEAEVKANDFLNQLTSVVEPKETPKVETKFVYPQFFLNSIVYNALDDWVVLINNQRFSARMLQEDPEIRILEVDNAKALIEWKPKNMKKVNESWENNKSDGVIVDNVVGAVTFTLYPNQTFSSYAMRVVEGKVRPIVVQLTQDDNVRAAPPVQNKADAASNVLNNDSKKIENTGTPDLANDVGMKGLDKTYKRMGLEN